MLIDRYSARPFIGIMGFPYAGNAQIFLRSAILGVFKEYRRIPHEKTPPIWVDAIANGRYQGVTPIWNCVQLALPSWLR